MAGTVAVAVAGVDKKKVSGEGREGTVWTCGQTAPPVLESDHGGAPSYTNICPQSAGSQGWPGLAGQLIGQNLRIPKHQLVSELWRREAGRDGQSLATLYTFIGSSCQ